MYVSHWGGFRANRHSGDQSVEGGKSAGPEAEQILIPTETQCSQTADNKCKILCTEHRTLPAESLDGDVWNVGRAGHILRVTNHTSGSALNQAKDPAWLKELSHSAVSSCVQWNAKSLCWYRATQPLSVCLKFTEGLCYTSKSPQICGVWCHCSFNVVAWILTSGPPKFLAQSLEQWPSSLISITETYSYKNWHKS